MTFGFAPERKLLNLVQKVLFILVIAYFNTLLCRRIAARWYG